MGRSGRAQALADVPVAISAVNADALANSGANDIRQLNQLAPSLIVSSTGSEANGSARIRGIGTVGDNPGLESSVATFVDGVYRNRAGVGLTELGAIDRIEVLRGSGAVLYGAGASAGVINVITRMARPGERSAELTAQGGGLSTGAIAFNGNLGGGFDSFFPVSPPYRYTWQQQILGTEWATMPYLPFFWNIIDEKSGLDLKAFRDAVSKQILTDFPNWGPYLTKLNEVQG